MWEEDGEIFYPIADFVIASIEKEVKSIKYNGDTAIVKVINHYDLMNVEPDLNDIRLKYVEGKWLVDQRLIG